MMFQGFSRDAVDFLWGIRFNNNREWFAEHRQAYLDYVDGPLRALSRQLLDAMNAAYPKAGFTQHVSRIYRDARRLYGRGPYKDHLWLVVERPQDGQHARPAFYFELAPNYFSYGCGFWDMSPALAAKLRARIDRDPKPLETLARRLNRSKFSLFGDEYKRPKGDAGKLLNPWYNRKNIGISYDANCEGAFFTPELFDEVLEAFRFLMPYYEYLDSLAADAAPEAPL
jgi:uncharacterized protein (TIGR02453 family)